MHEVELILFMILLRRIGQKENQSNEYKRLIRMPIADDYDELIDAAKKLKDGEYSTSIITTELGYHVILKTKTYEKDTFDNVKDKIKETLGERYVKNNQNSIGLTALQHYRKEYGMEIQDKEMQKQYSNYIQNALASIQNNNTKTNTNESK